MINGQFIKVMISCAKDAGSQSDLLLSSSTTPCSHPATASSLQGSTILNQKSGKTGFCQGLLEPLPQGWLGKGKQEGLGRLCRVILNATMPNLGAALAPANLDLVCAEPALSQGQ